MRDWVLYRMVIADENYCVYRLGACVYTIIGRRGTRDYRRMMSAKSTLVSQARYDGRAVLSHFVRHYSSQAEDASNRRRRTAYLGGLPLRSIYACSSTKVRRWSTSHKFPSLVPHDRQVAAHARGGAGDGKRRSRDEERLFASPVAASRQRQRQSGVKFIHPQAALRDLGLFIIQTLYPHYLAVVTGLAEDRFGWDSSAEGDYSL